MTAGLLATESLSIGYHGHAIGADLSLELNAGEVVALLGPNGAGKSTTLLTLAGDIPPLSGRVSYLGQTVASALHRRARQGLALVTEDRAVFMQLTVRENLRVGRCDVDAAVALFPELGALMSRRVGLLSGGEQQILALGRALARRPRVLLIDELSLGLAPMVVERLLAAVRAAASSGVGVLLVEQQIDRALSIADRVYVMRGGEIILQGAADEVAGQVLEIEASYLGDDVERARDRS